MISKKILYNTTALSAQLPCVARHSLKDIHKNNHTCLDHCDCILVLRYPSFFSSAVLLWESGISVAFSSNLLRTALS